MSTDYILVDDTDKRVLWLGPWRGLPAVVGIMPYAEEGVTEGTIHAAVPESGVWLPNVDEVIAWLRESRGRVLAWEDDYAWDGYTETRASGVGRPEMRYPPGKRPP